jgi:hypothetical protein
MTRFLNELQYITSKIEPTILKMFVANIIAPNKKKDRIKQKAEQAVNSKELIHGQRWSLMKF